MAIDKITQCIYNVFIMNNTAVINIRTEDRLKQQVQAIAEKLGLSISAIVNAYLKQLVRTKTIRFSLFKELTGDEWENTSYLTSKRYKKLIKEARDGIRKGDFVDFNDI